MSSIDYYNNVKDINEMIYENNIRLIERTCIELSERYPEIDVLNCVDEIKEKLLDDSFTKIKAKKDPNKPRRPLSSYTIFCNDIRDDLKKTNPKLSFGEMNKTLGQKWKELDDKQKYIEMAQEERLKYDEEIEEYNKQYGIL
tara:strand:+ start:2009 stop:2434 length:426 start_codon:yes stop_codon:yes gene_type:complete